MGRGPTMPESRAEMLRAMYVFLNAGKCKSCGAAIEWWQTTNGKRMPFDAPTTDNPRNEIAVTHFATCPNAKAHRGTGVTPTPAPQQSMDPRDRRSLANMYRGRGDARIVVAIYDDGFAWANRNGIAPEDLRHELITAANQIRRDMEARHVTS